MSFEIATTIEKQNQDSSDSSNQSIFLKQMITNNEITLSIEQLTDNQQIHCNECGYPLKLKQNKQSSQSIERDDITNEMKDNYEKCLICRRENILNVVLISSYLVTAAIFITSFIGVIYNQMGLDICLMIGCLEVIFLVYLGRYLEDAVYFKLTKEERLLAALYRYSFTGEFQALETARNVIIEMPAEGFTHEILKGILQVAIFQANCLPHYWFLDISKQMKIPIDELPKILLDQINHPNEKNFSSRLVKDAPLEGVSKIVQMAVYTKDQVVIKKVIYRLDDEMANEELNSAWKIEFFMFGKYYKKALDYLIYLDTKRKIDSIMIDFEEPKVPTIDVIGKSKSIIERNPFLRFIIRIFTYILIAFIVALLFNLFD